ncbi:MAG: UDP-N-acetylglucosamine 1-carboxyvinyltransferase, partial [Planctomycetota bacterium]
MDRLAIIGGRPLYGDVTISGAKNAALKAMAAALLSEKPVALSNTPRLADVAMLIRLLEELGVKSEWTGPNDLTLTAADIVSTVAPYDLVRKMRA